MIASGHVVGRRMGMGVCASCQSGSRRPCKSVLCHVS